MSTVNNARLFPHAEAATRNCFGQSHVVCKFRAYCLSKCYFVSLKIPFKNIQTKGNVCTISCFPCLFIGDIYCENMKHIVYLMNCANCSKRFQRLPGKFARANGLINKKCGLIIRDEKRRSWILKLYTSCSQVYIGGRWAEFRDANDIKEGDHITFKVVANGEMPIWKFHSKFSHLSNLLFLSNLFTLLYTPHYNTSSHLQSNYLVFGCPNCKKIS